MTEAKLQAAVFADPGSDAPRLVYSDWLQEKGDPRGELIVLQTGKPSPAKTKQTWVGASCWRPGWSW